MHYANGRAATAGDKVVNLETGRSGILHSTQAKQTTCNGRLAPISDNDPYVTIGQCVHVDDVKACAATLPNSATPSVVMES